MGYYVDFVFDPEVIDTPEKAFVELWAASYGDDPPDAAKRDETMRLVSCPRPPEMEPYVRLEGCPFDIRFNWDKAEKTGRWAQVRLSWGLDGDEARAVLACLLDLAIRAGCRLYDGERVLDSVEAAVKPYQRTASAVREMFGTVENPGDREREERG